MTRSALVAGIAYYSHLNGLYGCVNDAKRVADVLEHHGDDGGSLNF